MDSSLNLMYYGSRYYDTYLQRFLQPDSLMPDWYSPQYLNRYSYVRNNPVRYFDADGHCLPFCAPLLAAFGYRYLPRENLSMGARFVAGLNIPLVSDVAALDVNATDNLYAAVNGDKLGLSVERRVQAYRDATDSLIKEAGSIVIIVETANQAKEMLRPRNVPPLPDEDPSIAPARANQAAEAPESAPAPPAGTNIRPRPPGWDDTWTEDYGTRLGDTSLRDRDPQGGEWRWHEDEYHDGHWDYNPWDTWNSPWQNVDENGNPLP